MHVLCRYIWILDTSAYHKDGSNQRLKREEAIDKNHDKNAIAAEIRYLLQNFGGQKEPSELSKISTTLAVEQAAASVRIDNTQSPTMMISSIPFWRMGHLTSTEYPSSSVSVKLHGITNPIIVTKKQKEV